MKLNLKNFLIAMLLTSGAFARSEEAAAKTAAVKITASTNGESLVTLAVATQKNLGLEITNLVAAEWSLEIKAFGQVVDPAPLAELLMDYGRVLMTFDTSHQELERAKQLKKDGNLSEKAFLEAESTYRQNFSAVMVVWQKISSTWGKKFPEMFGEIVVPPGSPRKMNPAVDEATKPGNLIRIDLPVGERGLNLGAARLEPLAKSESPITAYFFDALPAVDPQTQQRGVLFWRQTGQLIPGEAVTAFIKTGVEPTKGATIPASAVIRHDGKAWVYLQASETNFTRREISLDRAMEGGFFTSELSTTNQLIVTGAQAMLSAELSAGNSGAHEH
jgi:hypothetical protein